MSSPSDDIPVRPASNPSSGDEPPGSRIVLEDEIVDRYLADVLRPNETERAKKFFSDPKRARILGWLREWAEGAEEAQPPRASQTLEQLWRQIDEHEATRPLEGTSSGRTTRGGMVGLGTQTMRQGGRGSKAQILRKWIWATGAAAIFCAVLIVARRQPLNDEGVSRVYTTKERQQALITLDDGTQVTLSPKTTLRLVHFGETSRQVVLDRGEAYFNVLHVSGTPFLVQSGAVTTRVLGTEFLVRRDAGTPRTRVAVASGKVRVSTHARISTEVTLVAGQIGDLSDSTSQVGSVSDIAPDAEWAPGQLLFRNTSVTKILQVLSRWYGYRFRYTDSTLAQQRMSVGISTQSSAEALAAIERVLVVNLTVIGDTVILTPHPAQSLHGQARVRTYDVWTPTKEVGR